MLASLAFYLSLALSSIINAQERPFYVSTIRDIGLDEKPNGKRRGVMCFFFAQLL